MQEFKEDKKEAEPSNETTGKMMDSMGSSPPKNKNILKRKPLKGNLKPEIQAKALNNKRFSKRTISNLLGVHSYRSLLLKKENYLRVLATLDYQCFNNIVGVLEILQEQARSQAEPPDSYDGRNTRLLYSTVRIRIGVYHFVKTVREKEESRQVPVDREARGILSEIEKWAHEELEQELRRLVGDDKNEQHRLLGKYHNIKL